MRLSPEQLAQFDRDGYLFFPGLFTPEETQVLNDAVPELYSRREGYNVREKGKDAVRTNFAAHMYSEPFARLARHPRMSMFFRDAGLPTPPTHHSARAGTPKGTAKEKAAADLLSAAAFVLYCFVLPCR